VDVPFADTPPFRAQFAAFTDAVAGRGRAGTAWPYDPARDLALHRLLLTALDGGKP
jgi:1,5-anhydro-D-fructose reductase (1,5-anhydro-D-mannitol-forming)